MGKKIRNVPWDKIRADYLREGQTVSMRELAIRYKHTGVTYSALFQKAAKEKWVDSMKALHSKVKEKVENEVVKSMADMVKSIIMKKYPPELWAEQLSRVAGFDLAALFEVDTDTGETKLRRDWPKHAKGGVLAGVKVKCLTTEEGLVVQQVEIKPQDTMEAHRRIGNLVGFEPEKPSANAAQNVQINVTLPPWANIFGIPEDAKPPERVVEDETKKEDKNEN